MPEEKRTYIIFVRADIAITEEGATAYVLSDEEMAQLGKGEFIPPEFPYPGNWFLIGPEGALREANGIIRGNWNVEHE